MILIKRINLLRLLNYFILIVLCWSGSILTPCHAQTDTTYYTFVMHKLDATDDWQFLYHFDKLLPGIYQFHIVRFTYPQNGPENWSTLQGQLKFIPDPQGGVKVDQQTIVFYEQNALNPWTNITNNWAQIRQNQLEPIISYMKREEPLGYPNPNLVRFLLLKTGIEESWLWGDKNYQIYRLHHLNNYTDDVTYSGNLKALSHFINPSAESTTDLKQIKEWLDNPALANYLEIPTQNPEFYDNVKNWFNQLFDTGNHVTFSDKKDETTLFFYEEVWFLVAILLVVIAVIIGITIKFRDKLWQIWLDIFSVKKHEPDMDYQDDDPSSSKPHLSFFKKKMATTLFSSDADYEETDDEIDLLHKELKQLNFTLHRLKQEEITAMNQKLLELEQSLTNITENRVFKESEFPKMVGRVLQDHFPILLSSMTSRLFHDPEFKKAMENHIDSYLHSQFNHDVNKTIELYAEKYWQDYIAEKQGKEISLPTQKEDFFAQKPLSQAQNEPEETFSQPLSQTDQEKKDKSTNIVYLNDS
ncbi:membrane protein [Beggiatoa sp. PS]|nr:membrane protein [Beggiatoa sp. PS]